MSLTPGQHRRLGQILGYPICCVEAFVADTSNYKAKRRGLVVLPDRSPDDIMRVELEASLMLGRLYTTGNHRQYVPCAACVGSEGWISWRDRELEIIFELRSRIAV